ncbi:prepilin-type N-terminal cleavage/methylation domain-containing protein [Patescibacteria group bacterium]|nr:prepilin-type N-terminal cleavage/methylation domain-containing protein [Patescibacteria group bacterium]
MKKAFTLIEILVALSIFMVVIIVVLTTFLSGINGQRKVIALQDVQDNARFLMNFMVKEIRMSEINSFNSSSLNITRPDGESVSYLFNNANGKIERTDSTTSGPISSDNVFILGGFYGSGVGKLDGLQAKITIVMDVQKNSAKEQGRASIKIQTTVSQRNLDL